MLLQFYYTWYEPNYFLLNCMQHFGQEKGEEDLPEGVLSVSLLKHQVSFFLIIAVL
jgi:hypothetical protein